MHTLMNQKGPLEAGAPSTEVGCRTTALLPLSLTAPSFSPFLLWSRVDGTGFRVFIVLTQSRALSPLPEDSESLDVERKLSHKLLQRGKAPPRVSAA